MKREGTNASTLSNDRYDRSYLSNAKPKPHLRITHRQKARALGRQLFMDTYIYENSIYLCI